MRSWSAHRHGPLTADRVQGAEKGVTGSGTRGGETHTPALHPPRAHQRQQVQFALVQGEQVGQPVGGRPGGLSQRRAFHLRLGVGLAGRRQAGTRPPPAHAMQGAPHAGAREHQAAPARQEGGQQRHAPAGLDVARAARGLAGLRLHDGAGQLVLGRAPAAWLIGQAGDPVLRVAVQPGPHHVRPAGRDRGDLWDGVASARQQDQVCPQRHPPDGLPTHSLQLPLLGVCQRQMDHRLLPPARQGRQKRATLLTTCLVGTLPAQAQAMQRAP